MTVQELRDRLAMAPNNAEVHIAYEGYGQMEVAATYMGSEDGHFWIEADR